MGRIVQIGVEEEDDDPSLKPIETFLISYVLYIFRHVIFEDRAFQNRSAVRHTRGDRQCN